MPILAYRVKSAHRLYEVIISRKDKKSNMNIAIYARVSTAAQAEKGYSLETQVEACRTNVNAEKKSKIRPLTHLFLRIINLNSLPYIVYRADCLFAL